MRWECQISIPRQSSTHQVLNLSALGHSTNLPTAGVFEEDPNKNFVQGHIDCMGAGLGISEI